MTKITMANKRLADWMSAMQLNDRQVAESVGVDVAYVWRMRNGRIAVADSFAWKFAAAYGYDTARRLFQTERNPA